MKLSFFSKKIGITVDSKCILTTLVLIILSLGQVYAAKTKLKSLPDFIEAISKASPGDTLILADGIYTSKEPLYIKARGTKYAPITIKAQSIGGVKIQGSDGFQIIRPAQYLIIQGFRFNNKTGKFQIRPGARNCILTRNIFECTPAGKGNKPYLSISGDNNEISYNIFRNKDTEGCMITIQGPGKSGMAQNTWIHHNLFNNFKNSRANNSSAIQAGLSSRSLTPAHTLIERNLFLNCRGENEGIIANKSSDNIYRFNTFGQGCTEVSLRHGDRLQVYSNFFIGNTGLRFSGDNHKIYSNYFENCDFAINCTNGDGDVHQGDDLRSHDRPDNVQIFFNTLINNKINFKMPSRKNGLGATGIEFSYNIIQGGDAISLEGTNKNFIWRKNILYQILPGDMPKNGYQSVNPQLKKDSNGISHLSSQSPAIDQQVFKLIEIDIDGQSRDKKRDLGADEFSNAPIKNHPLSSDDVGPFAENFKKQG